jgi:hypothetical protein
MPIGIAAPQPSGIPGFNLSGMYLVAGIGGGAINARQLPGWYNVVRSVINANDSVALPPAVCGGEPVIVYNYSNAIDPVTNNPVGVSNTLVVFGSTNPFGVEDTIDNAGVQGTAGVAIPAGSMAMFWATTPQSGFTNDWNPGRWNYKILT